MAFAIRFPNIYRHAGNKHGSVFDHRVGNEWRPSIRRRLLRGREATEMTELMVMVDSLSLSPGRDHWKWRWNNNKNFTVKSMYDILLKQDRDYSQPADAFPFKLVWEVSIPTNVKLFIWALLWERVLTIDNLNGRGIAIHNACALCNQCEESINHLFFGCPLVLDIWYGLVGHIPRMGGILNHDNPKAFLTNWPKLNNRGIGEASWCLVPYATLWVVWCIRNHIIFENGVFEVEKVIMRVKGTIWAWLDMLCRKVDVKKGYQAADMLRNWQDLVCDRW
ncbi:hypothetical protein FRX31_017102 [Thalictrum thalictroides]|uniref:Reverse transcriptase zinc-binding domain-containing protein n=1 Tax=Thalictrum thalictroides TaxID=46969 RepID=A0A7J6W7U0_THATH|nr:hypothetical protein FRX31_017102 [Thalictrum thalictroides]